MAEVIKQFGITKSQAVCRETRHSAPYRIETSDGTVLTLLPEEFDEMLLALIGARREWELRMGSRVR